MRAATWEITGATEDVAQGTSSGPWECAGGSRASKTDSWDATPEGEEPRASAWTSAEEAASATSAIASKGFDDDSSDDAVEDIASDARSFSARVSQSKEAGGTSSHGASHDATSTIASTADRAQEHKASTWEENGQERIAKQEKRPAWQQISAPESASYADNGVIARVADRPEPTIVQSLTASSPNAAGAAAAEQASSAPLYSATGIQAGSGGIFAAIGVAVLVCITLIASVLAFVLLASSLTQQTQDEGHFGAMYFWIEYETGKTDDSAFATVTLDDGLGGQAYGVQFDLLRGSLMSFLRWGVSEQPDLFAAFTDLAQKPASELYATSLDDPLPAAWRKTYSEHKQAFIEAQKTYVYLIYYLPVEQRLERAGWSISDKPDAVKGSIMSWAHQHGTGSITSTTLAQAGITNSDTPAQFISKLYAYRTERYGSYAGLDLKSRYDREVQTALSLLPGAGGGASSNAVVGRAYSQIGKVTYTWGGCAPGAMDCSGFVSYCLTGEYKRLGTTRTFLTWERPSDPRPGDVCTNDVHCGIYIGDGQMIDCGDVGVAVHPVDPTMVIVRYGG